MGRPATHERIRHCVLAVLMRGECRPADAARRAGVSVQLVNKWLNQARLSWDLAYETRVNGVWERAWNGRAKPMRKKRARAVANRAKREWDRRNEKPQAVGD